MKRAPGGGRGPAQRNRPHCTPGRHDLPARGAYVGGVIQAGEVLMLVVPEADDLVIEARVAPQDIDQVHIKPAGRRAVLRLQPANDAGAQRRGDLDRPDITTDERKAMLYYSVRVRISDKELAASDGLLPLPACRWKSS